MLVIGLTVGSASAFAQTTTQVGSHRRPYMAGFSDSIHNKGAWILINPAGTIKYVDEDPTIVALWKQVMNTLYGIELK